MMKSNVAEIISEWIETKLELPFIIYSDILADVENDGACVRHDPTPAAEERYIDGSRLVTWNLTFFVRCKNSEDAREWAKKIIDNLDGATITNTENDDINCEAVTLPQFIEVDSKSFTVYSASITCKFLEKYFEE